MADKTGRELDAEVADKYRAGMSCAAIGRLIGWTEQVVWSHLKRMGIKCRSNSESHRGQPAWNNNGGHLDSMGYRRVWKEGKAVREHRVVAEIILGRRLLPKEVVHHKNGDRCDNRPENLEIIASHSEHMRQHMTAAEARRRGRRGGWAKRAAIKAHQEAHE